MKIECAEQAVATRNNEMMHMEIESTESAANVEHGFLVCLPCAEALFYETVQ